MESLTVHRVTRREAIEILQDFRVTYPELKRVLIRHPNRGTVELKPLVHRPNRRAYCGPQTAG